LAEGTVPPEDQQTCLGLSIVNANKPIGKTKISILPELPLVGPAARRPGPARHRPYGIRGSIGIASEKGPMILEVPAPIIISASDLADFPVPVCPGFLLDKH
jgi:hypothetical protein